MAHSSRNEKAVPQAWAAGKRLTRDSLKTDGENIWSYAHLIGERRDGKLVAYGCRYSVTTRRHVNGVRLVADVELDHCPSCEEVAA